MTLLWILGAKYLYLAALLTAVVAFWLLPSQRRQIVILAVIALPLTYLAAKLGGHLYNDPRPFVVGHFTPLVPHDPDNGFPSDHTLLVSALAALFFWVDKRTSFILAFVALIVGVSRVQ